MQGFKITKKAEADAKRLYKAGHGVRATADILGCSFGTARKMLTSSGVTMRKPGGVKKVAAKPAKKAVAKK